MTMTSIWKTQANRENSHLSTGPKSAAGRLRSARNSRRHGLSIPVTCDPKLSADVEHAALEIVGANAGARLTQLARPVAEAQIDLLRVRRARHSVMEPIFDDPRSVHTTQAASMGYARALTGIDKLLERGMPIPRELTERVERRGESEERFTLVTSKCTQSLAAMDRYERRALSRRKKAIRALDAASLAQSAIAVPADPEYGVASAIAANPLPQNHFAGSRHRCPRVGLDTGGRIWQGRTRFFVWLPVARLPCGTRPRQRPGSFPFPPSLTKLYLGRAGLMIDG